MRSRWHSLALASGLALAAVAGCAGENQPSPHALDVPEARSDKQRLAADAPAASVDKLTHDNAAFAWDLLHAVGPSGNFFYSPHSVSIAFAMAYAGASGEVKAEVAKVLHFEQPDAELHAAFNTLDQALASRGAGAQASDGTPFRLRISNALWAQTASACSPVFLDVLAEDYGAGVELVDFAGDCEGARKTINAWVSHETETKIPELLPKGIVDSTTTFVLTNTVYFNAAWARAFDAADTQAGAFTRLDGTSLTAELMHGGLEDARYAEGDGWKAAELPYSGNQVSMLVVLPDVGRFSEIEQGLDADRLDQIHGALGSGYTLGVTLPKFELRTHKELKQVLAAMGMPSAFSSADFPGISPGAVITSVTHEAFVKVNEAGTEAAAATAIVGGGLSMPSPTKVANLDVTRPFIFVIEDLATGAEIFVGRVVEPNAG